MQIPHFNYVGDSILGYKSHIGAGVKLSNLKSDKSLISITHNGESIDTELKYFNEIVLNIVLFVPFGMIASGVVNKQGFVIRVAIIALISS